ncbi:hypothetical protein [Halonotius sp. GCM10025705]|uniref:hypothetical protein n=1 Tax=Halonotius sp. GCM10025705 TaxID=3252678 RepID=UPI00360667D1
MNTPETLLTEVDDKEAGVATDTNASVAQAAIHIQAERIKTAELQQAYNRLDVDSSLSTTEKEILETMATAIVDEIVAAPVSVLDRADAYDDDTVETALELFNPTDE